MLRKKLLWIGALLALTLAAGVITVAAQGDEDARLPIVRFAEDDAFIGPEDAPVVIVEFSDFQCGFCGKFYRETLPLIIEKYPTEVKFIYRDFPIFGDDSVRGAIATECAEEQGFFWEMHDAIFDGSGLSHDGLVNAASDIGMDVEAFDQCLLSARYLPEVAADYQDGSALGFTGTPAFVINGKILSGAQPFSVFDEIIAGELAINSEGPPEEAPPAMAFELTDFWYHVAPMHFVYVEEAETLAEIQFSAMTLDMFAQNLGVPMPESDPMLVLLDAVGDSFTAQITGSGLEIAEDAFEGPEMRTFGEFELAYLRMKVDSQTAADGTENDGIDIALVFIDRGDGNVHAVQYTREGDHDSALYDSFETWLAANAAALSEPIPAS